MQGEGWRKVEENERRAEERIEGKDGGKLRRKRGWRTSQGCTRKHKGRKGEKERRSRGGRNSRTRLEQRKEEGK